MDVRDIIPWRRRRRGRFSPSTSLFDDSFFPERFFDEFFERGFGESGRFDPSIDVAEKESGIEVTAELPGLEQEDIELTLDEHGLTLRGEKREERKEEDGDFYRSERTFGSFQRFIPLSSEIDRENVRASFKNGVLRVRLPKAGEEKQSGKRIEIEG